jgi:glycosyltransferase involved in cell wall biosynthesis
MLKTDHKCVVAIHTLHNNDQAIAYIYSSLCIPEPKGNLKMIPLVPSLEPSKSEDYLVPVVPKAFKPVIYKLNYAAKWVEDRFLKELKKVDAGYLWPGVSLQTIKTAKNFGKPLFIAPINCSQGKSKIILDDAYARLNIYPQHGITEEDIAIEKQQMEATDFVFCPSPEVKSSFIEMGIGEEKLFLSSFGWGKKRFPYCASNSNIRPRCNNQEEGLNILFMGSVCVRKGAHLLMEYFIKSGVKGRLILCGKLEPAIAEVCKDYLKLPNIEHYDFNPNIAQLYEQADLFAFPSLEEGGPLVTYEAMAHGLPVLVSPMGAGSVVRDTLDGWILPPYEEDAWIEKLRELARFADLRWQVGQSARTRAQDFEWERVASQRADVFLQHI